MILRYALFMGLSIAVLYEFLRVLFSSAFCPRRVQRGHMRVLHLPLTIRGASELTLACLDCRASAVIENDICISIVLYAANIPNVFQIPG
jgi:hypothetical protein